jgi:hypothetical protein
MFAKTIELIDNQIYIDGENLQINSIVKKIFIEDPKKYLGLNYLPPVLEITKSSWKITTSNTNWPLVAVLRKKNHLIVTTDVSIFRREVSNFNSINEKMLWSYVFFGGCINSLWLLKDVFVVAPGVVFNININGCVVSQKELIQTSSINKNLKVQHLPSIFIESTVKILKNLLKYKRPLCLGVSGGVDSRIVLALSDKANLPISCFLIGRKKGRFGLYTQDYLSSVEISKIYGRKIQVINPRNTSLDDRISKDVNTMPMCGSEFGRLANLSFEDSSILLNGGWGFWVQKPSLNLNFKEIVLKSKSYFNIRKRYHLIDRAFSRIFGLKVTPLDVARKLSNKVYFSLNSVISKFESGHHHLSLEEKVDVWSHQITGGTISSGVFESHGNSMPPLSIYEEYFSKNPNLRGEYNSHIDRKFLLSVLNLINPELVDIPGQGGRVFTRGARFSKFKVVARQAIVGHGVMNYKDDFDSKDIQPYLIRVKGLLRYLGSDLNVDQLWRLTCSGRISPAILSNLIKSSILLRHVFE